MVNPEGEKGKAAVGRICRKGSAISAQRRFVAAWGRGTGPPNRGQASKFGRTLDTLWSVASRKKISKFDATRYQILWLKCTKFDFSRVSAGFQGGKGRSLQRSPESPSCI